jgi:hypothetical protein
MIMPDQSRRSSRPRQLGRREKTALAVLIGCVVLAAIGLGAFALTSGAPARADCIDLTFPSTLGAGEVHECGMPARRICASKDAYRGIAKEMRVACRRAGFPYGG